VWEGTVEKFAEIDTKPLTDWLLPIPFEVWPQQNPANQELKPAMTNESWYGLKGVSDYLVDELCPLLGAPKIKDRMLSVVMPGHDIAPHMDVFGPEWICRVHVPLTTNGGAIFMVEEAPYWMKVGYAYKVNISKVHAVVNYGKTPRIHFMFDCYAA
jgi:aspartyl/asparaginyl beta-hydroxylase